MIVRPILDIREERGQTQNCGTVIGTTIEVVAQMVGNVGKLDTLLPALFPQLLDGVVHGQNADLVHG